MWQMVSRKQRKEQAMLMEGRYEKVVSKGGEARRAETSVEERDDANTANGREKTEGKRDAGNGKRTQKEIADGETKEDGACGNVREGAGSPQVRGDSISEQRSVNLALQALGRALQQAVAKESEAERRQLEAQLSMAREEVNRERVRAREAEKQVERERQLCKQAQIDREGQMAEEVRAEIERAQARVCEEDKKRQEAEAQAEKERERAEVAEERAKLMTQEMLAVAKRLQKEAGRLKTAAKRVVAQSSEKRRKNAK